MDEITVKKMVEKLYVASVTHPIHGLVSGYGISEQAARDDLQRKLTTILVRLEQPNRLRSH